MKTSRAEDARMATLKAIIEELRGITDPESINVVHLERGDHDFVGNHLVTVQVVFAAGSNGKPVGPSRDVGGCND